MKRRLPKGTDIKYAKKAVKDGTTRKSAKALQHLWVSREKRRTHKRERREERSNVETDF